MLSLIVRVNISSHQAHKKESRIFQQKKIHLNPISRHKNKKIKNKKDEKTKPHSLDYVSGGFVPRPLPFKGIFIEALPAIAEIFFIVMSSRCVFFLLVAIRIRVP